MKRASVKAASPVVLLTGFGPFGGETINPAWEAACALQGARITPFGSSSSSSAAGTMLKFAAIGVISVPQ